jgi:hypothetical protein
MKRFVVQALTGVVVLTVLAYHSGQARADLTLTQAGIDRGLSLSTFAINFPTTGVGPLGIAFPNSGGVLVTDYPGNIRLFPGDTDGQNAATVPPTQNYGFANAIGLAKSGGLIYMTRQGVGDLVQVNDNGTFNHVVATGLPAATGIITNPTNGHVFVSTLGNGLIVDVNPVNGMKTTFKSGVSADGLSTDGTILYAAMNGNSIVGYRISDGMEVFNSGFIGGGPDGTALGAERLAGNIYANNNNGEVVEINLTTLAQTVIATGGSRGDFASVDPNDGSLLVTQSDRIVRIQGPFQTATPEPSTFILLGIGILGFLGYAWRHSSRRSTPSLATQRV